MSKRPDGTYEARAVEAVLGLTKGGAEQVGVGFVFEDELGGGITWYGYFTEKSIQRTLETLRRCGWKGTDLDNLSGINGTAQVALVLETEEYEGKFNQKVKWVNGATGVAMAAPLNEGQAKSFAQRMKGHVLAFDQGAGASAQSKPAPKTTARAPQHRSADADVFTEDKPPF